MAGSHLSSRSPRRWSLAERAASSSGGSLRSPLPRVPSAMLSTRVDFRSRSFPAALKAARTILIGFVRVKKRALRCKYLISEIKCEIFCPVCGPACALRNDCQQRSRCAGSDGRARVVGLSVPAPECEDIAMRNLTLAIAALLACADIACAGCRTEAAPPTPSPAGIPSIVSTMASCASTIRPDRSRSAVRTRSAGPARRYWKTAPRWRRKSRAYRTRSQSLKSEIAALREPPPPPRPPADLTPPAADDQSDGRD